MLFRSKDGVELYKVPSSNQEETDKGRKWLLKGATTLQVVSPDGRRVYLHQSSVGVVMRSLDTEDSSSSSTETTPFLKDSKGVQFLTTSPKGTYVLTWERPSASDPQQPNLKVWNGSTGDYLYGVVQRAIKKDAWPYMQWTHDERYAFLLATNEIRVYDGNAFTAGEEQVRYIDKMRSQGVASMSVPKQASPGSSYLLTSFVPKTKDKPARMSLLRYPNKTTSSNSAGYPALVSKSLYQVEEVVVQWSPKGDAALAAMQTSVDTSGESYYGSTTLHLFLSDGATSDAINVPLPKNSTGPVLDVSWMPNPTKPPCFAVISGRMPAMASLHHGTTGEPSFLFGNAHRNTVSWSPHGRFVCLAGFGNLAGGMTFWDRNKLKPIPQYDGNGEPIPNPDLTASCTVGYGWSPDSRTFFSSTTSPRMNVDNGVRLFSYNGHQLTNVPWNNDNYKPDRLLEAVFVPAPSDTYPDRPQSPPPRGVKGDTAAAATPVAAAAAPVAAPPKPAGRYVPPSARGKTGGGTSLAERMRREKEGSMMGATKVTKTTTVGVSSSSSGRVIPGMAPSQPDGSGKSKNAQRKERQRAAKAKKQEEEERKKAEEETAAAAASAAAAQDPEKRARKIKKSLKQIDDIKSKDPATLNEDQKKKLATEEELREELAKLGV